MAFAAEAISSNDLLKQVWLMAGKPGAQGRADIEAQASIIIDNGRDTVAVPEQARRRIGPCLPAAARDPWLEEIECRLAAPRITLERPHYVRVLLAQCGGALARARQPYPAIVIIMLA